MTHHDEEFAALRATIRERGTVRMVLLPLTFGIWAGAAVASLRTSPMGIATDGTHVVFTLHGSATGDDAGITTPPNAWTTSKIRTACSAATRS